jgi:ATP-binding cassette subfamily B protein
VERPHRGRLLGACLASEARLAAASSRLNSWRAPEGRRLDYLEWILTRDSHVQEVKVFGLGPLVLARYRALFTKFYDEDRPLAVRRMVFGVLFGVVSLAACPPRAPSATAGSICAT